MEINIADFGIAGLAARIASASTCPCSPDNRRALAKAIGDFHNSCELAPTTLAKSLEAIQSGAKIVRLAHQPNFLPYDNLLLQMRYLHHLVSQLQLLGSDAVAVILFVDHDVASNKRFRTSELISLTSPDLVTQIDYPISAAHRLIADQQSPSDESIAAICARIQELSNQLPPVGPHARRSLAAIRADVAPSLVEPLSVARVTAFSWMRVAYDYAFAPDVLFVPLSALYAHLRPVYLELNGRLGPDPAGFERYWAICLNCQGRQRVRKTDAQHIAECSHCGMVEGIADPLRDDGIRIVPRVLVDVLSDYQGLDVAGGTAYRSAISHLIKSQALGCQIGITAKPEAAWRTNILHTGAAGRAAYTRAGSRALSGKLREVLVTGRMSLAYYVGLENELERLRSEFDLQVSSQNAPQQIDLHPNGDSALREWLQ